MQLHDYLVPTYRAARRLTCVLGIAALGACSLFSSTDERYEPAKLTEYAPELVVNKAWTASFGSGGGLGFVPAIVGPDVYAATANGKVAKYELATGRQQWVIDTDTDLTAGVGSDGQLVVVASPRGEVIALDASGQEKWRAHATSEVSIPPAVGNGIVVVRSGDYRIQAFDAETGKRIWSVQRPGPALAVRAGTQMVMIDGMVLTGLPGGKILALDAATGNVQWEGTVAIPKGAGDLERVTDVVGAPQLAGPLMCAVAYQGRVVCFDVAAGGTLRWAKDFSSSSGMTVDRRNAYAANLQGEVHAFALDGGANLWRQNALRNRQLSAPAATGDSVAVGDYQGIVHFLSPVDGRQLARISVGGGAVVSPLQATQNGVLVQRGDGDLTLLSVE
ncbi:outer membrane protein assembly factor BamB [Alcaligenaceae bacterium SJ-26]|nr:outer membrane protein assembly factor BamB [Alcaligenaceae bacterium SJ-26]